MIELLINNIRLVRAQIVDATSGDWVLDYILDVVTIQIIVTDVVGAGLTCPGANAVTCSGAVNGAVCPAASTIATLTGAGITVAALPVNGALQFAYTCNVN